MPKRSLDALQKHTLNLYEGDFDKITALFPDMQPSVVVRELVRSTIERHEAAAPIPGKISEQVQL